MHIPKRLRSRSLGPELSGPEQSTPEQSVPEKPTQEQFQWLVDWANQKFEELLDRGVEINAQPVNVLITTDELKDQVVEVGKVAGKIELLLELAAIVARNVVDVRKVE